MQILFRPLSDDPRTVAAEPVWELYEEGPFDLDAARLRYRGILESWAALHGLRTKDLTPRADTEDWTENAVRLLAAVGTGMSVHPVRRGSEPADFAVGPSFGDASPWDPSTPSVFAGSVLRNDPLFVLDRDRRDLPEILWPAGGCRPKGEHYWRDPILLGALGRRAAISSGNPGGDDGYVAVTRRLLEDGADDVRAKIVFQSKYDHPHVVPLPRTASGRPVTDENAIRKGFIRAFDVNLLDCEERDECFLIQEDRPMTAEYRIVVADGEPAAGAGCVENLCPIFHDPADGPFDPVVEGRRGDGDATRRPDLVMRYVDRARELCAALAASGSDDFADCTMDFALDVGTDAVVLVETNPLQNFGLYAMDFGPVMAAGLRAASRLAPEADGPFPRSRIGG